LVFPYRRVRHVDDEIGAIERLGQTLAGYGVYARVRGGCEHIMAALGQVPHKLRPYEPGAPDDDDPHGFSVSPDRNRCRRCASRLPVRSEEVLAATLNCPSGSLGYSSKEVPFGMGCSNQALRYYQWAETFTSCPGQGAEALGEGVPTCSSRLDTTGSTRNAGSSAIPWNATPS